MRLFLDANMLVSVLNKEYPLFTYSSRIVSLSNRSDFDLYTSPLCLAIAFYFAQKKQKASATSKINLLCKHIQIAPNSTQSVQSALSNKQIHDFEDGLEYYAAIEQNCTCIITEDVQDFYFSDIEVLNCQSFFEKYLSL